MLTEELYFLLKCRYMLCASSLTRVRVMWASLSWILLNLQPVSELREHQTYVP